MSMMDALDRAMEEFYSDVERIQNEAGYTTQHMWDMLKSNFGEQVANQYKDWMGE